MLSTIGNIGHVIVLLNSLIYCYEVVFQNENNPYFDPQWQKRGFCLLHYGDAPNTKSSHYLSFYMLGSSAILTILLYKLIHKSPGMEGANSLVKPNVIAFFGHAIAHYLFEKHLGEQDIVEDGLGEEAFYSTSLWESSLKDESLSDLSIKLIRMNIGLTLLMKGPLKISTAGIFGVLVTTGFILIPSRFLFTFVITNLLMSRGVAQLLRPSKEKDDFSYAMWPWMVYVPIGIVGWVEAIGCEYIVNYGGHVVYDSTIVFSQTIFYLVCYIKGKREAEKQKSM